MAHSVTTGGYTNRASVGVQVYRFGDVQNDLQDSPPVAEKPRDVSAVGLSFCARYGVRGDYCERCIAEGCRLRAV